MAKLKREAASTRNPEGGHRPAGKFVRFVVADSDGQKYEVTGKIGKPNHSIQFKITFPRTVQIFEGFLFTGDGKAITGSSKLQERETGFYALRVEE